MLLQQRSRILQDLAGFSLPPSRARFDAAYLNIRDIPIMIRFMISRNAQDMAPIISLLERSSPLAPDVTLTNMPSIDDGIRRSLLVLTPREHKH